MIYEVPNPVASYTSNSTVGSSKQRQETLDIVFMCWTVFDAYEASSGGSVNNITPTVMQTSDNIWSWS